MRKISVICGVVKEEKRSQQLCLKARTRDISFTPGETVETVSGSVAKLTPG